MEIKEIIILSILLIWICRWVYVELNYSIAKTCRDLYNNSLQEKQRQCSEWRELLHKEEAKNISLRKLIKSLINIVKILKSKDGK